MLQSLPKYLFINSVIFLLFLGCSPDATIQQEQETKKMAIAQSTTRPTTTPNIPNNQFEQVFESQEEAAIGRIKKVFDKGLKGTSKNRGLPYLYKEHAHRMRMDYFNKYPYTLNYPYNDKFDLSVVKEEIPSLSFLTKKCGFQKEENDKTINIYYYCLKKEGAFINLLEDLGKENSLIVELHRDYVAKKHISKEIKQLLVMNSSDDFDFQRPEHQLVYMFYQILINEERLAANKL